MNFQRPLKNNRFRPAPGFGEDRASWQLQRAEIERSGALRSISGPRAAKFMAFKRRVFGWANLGSPPLHWNGLHSHLIRRAKRLNFRFFDVPVYGLPAAFEGYRLLHLSDLHLGGVTGLEDSLASLLKDIETDAVVYTGDFIDDFHDDPASMAPALRKILGNVSIADGVLAVLGNHDGWRSVAVLEGLGYRVLVNESVTLERGDARLVFTGTDDPSYYYTDRQPQAFDRAPEGCRIAMSHSADLADAAARNGYGLYLAGHTHGGQVCFPGGRPLYLDLQVHREFGEGLWVHAQMTGYTNVGAGASIMPYRFFKPGEVALLTLRQHPLPVADGRP
ncbi:metallophosphoesterase [Magnetospira thiophila]